LALSSGTLTLIVFGSLYTFGALTPYISSYLYYQNDETTSSALSILFTLTFVTVNVGIVLSTLFLSKLSNRIQCIIAVICMSGSVFGASFMTTFFGFCVFYGLFYGISIGIGYFPPVKNCYLHLPTRKGLCSGVCMSGFGLGSAIFNYLIVGLINPNDIGVDPVTKKYPL
jgi:OFA family oxalate/formate antiporter-like MFS transporter